MAISEVNRAAIKSGLSLFLTGAAYTAIARRYSHVSNCSTKAQLGAFAIAGVVQGFFASFLFMRTNKPYSSSQTLLDSVVLLTAGSLLTGVTLKNCGFKKPLLKATGIALSSFALDWVYRKKPDEPLKLSVEDFRRLLLSDRVPNRNIYVKGNIDLSGCTSLTSLPEGLSVSGELDLRCCERLTSLPEGLKVVGNLNLEGCTSLTSLPEVLHVYSDLNLKGCIRLTSLPNWITELGYKKSGLGYRIRSSAGIRKIDLTGIGLSDDIIDGLRNTPAPGMRFIFGRQAAALDEITFSSLEQALSFWTALDRTVRVPRIVLQESDKADMVQFLGRLSNTAEYRNLQTRTILAKRILKMVSFLSENEETKAKAFEIIHEGLTSCDDRIIAALDDVELLEKIHAAEKDSPSVEAERKLRSLGLALYRLEEVRRYATAHMRTLTWVDEVEVQLAFQIGFTQMLGLPLSTQNMLFRGCAGVSDEKIAAIGQKILRESTKERIDQFLACWDPWNRHNRRKALPAYEELPLEATPTQGPVQCTVLQEKAAMPVRHGQNVFGYEAFCKVYVESGKDPCTNMPIDWSDVRRIRCS